MAAAGISDRRTRPLILLICLATPCFLGNAGEPIGGFGREPALLSSRQLPPVRANPTSNINPQPDLQKEDSSPTDVTNEDRAPAPKKSWRERRGEAARSVAKNESLGKPEIDTDVSPRDEASDVAAGENHASEIPDVAPEVAAVPSAPPPTPEVVESYRVRLESRLVERYNNLPEYAGQVGRVTVILSRPLEYSLDARLIRAEFDQVVHDIWGKRLPALEKEYYVVTFGSGGAELVRSDPSVRIGLDMEKVYSERAPLAADPFRNVEGNEAFRPAPNVKMPQWWRPDFPELDY